MRPIEDTGETLAFRKPLRPPRREAGSLPEPGRHTDCLIITNDRTNGDRPRLALAAGGAWYPLAFADEIPPPPNALDVTQLVRSAVADEVRALPRPTPVALAAPAQAPTPGVAELAQALLEVSETLSGALARIAELEQRVEAIDRTPIQITKWQTA